MQNPQELRWFQDETKDKGTATTATDNAQNKMRLKRLC